MNKKKDSTTQRLIWGGVVLLLVALLMRYATFGGTALRAIPFDALGFILLGVGLYRILRAQGADKS
jgi:hypothetical protein